VSAGTRGRVGSVINGKWQVDARIGSGGMATVYAATHRNGHRAAIKMLHTQLSRDASTRARFLREGYVANAVGHPGVVGVLDDGVTEDGDVFLVLELLEGETIDDRRKSSGGALSIDESLDLADQALDALAAAHEKGVVHRDIKPENVFRTKDGRIKLLDFGLARMKDVPAEATRTGVTIGTPEFMPPEQALGRRDAIDARSDVWAVGATLFTTITGRYVHDDAQSLHEQLVASATRRSPPIRQFAPQLTASVAAVIDRALELEMSDRWANAREMQVALRSARESKAMTGKPPGDSMTIAFVPPSRRAGDDEVTRDHHPRAVVHTDGPHSSRGTGSVTTDVRVDGPTVAAAWVPTPLPSALGSGDEAPLSQAPPHSAGPYDLPRPSTRPLGHPTYDPKYEQGYAPASGYPPPLPGVWSESPGTMAGGGTGPGTGPIAPIEREGSLRAILLVAIGFIVLCAAMAAYVLWRGPRGPL
jgi:serine/threonine-protein kinase